ncbi:MAG: CHASE3 domain-containing protein [Nocardioides sp.]|uniref:sensor histidine kinase n=1 Tax=Nocardioides sp. TaxID=35761 RepID=UPI0039E38229
MSDGATRRRFASVTVEGWLNLLLGILAVLVTVGAVVATQLLHRTNVTADHLIERVQPAQAEAYRLQAALVDQETGLRGYALTADQQFLEPYTQGQADAETSMKRIRRLLPGDTQVVEDLAALEKAVATWREDYAQPLVDSVVVGNPRPVDKRSATEAKTAFDDVRALFDVQNADLAASNAVSVSRLDRARAQRTWVLIGLLVALGFAAVGILLLMRRLVVRPLALLRTSSRRVAQGDFEHPISEFGPADIRAVAHDVESMRERVVAELTASRDATRALDAQAVELRRSNGELEQFAYVASHDLQEPLRKVASFCQLLEKRYAGQLDERGQQYIDFAVDGAKRMQVLITDLLTFSRVGRTSEFERQVSLDTKLDKALDNLVTAVEESGARIERPERLPTIGGDPTLLVMLWQNLVGNAIKFRSPDRSPVVTIDCVPDPDAAPGGGWLLSVTDNGIGIPAEFAEKVFVIFQRLHSREAYAGTGIGLALCKKIVDYHGGRMWIDLDHTPGARLCFTLPAMPAERPDLPVIPSEGSAV